VSHAEAELAARTAYGRLLAYLVHRDDTRYRAVITRLGLRR